MSESHKKCQRLGPRVTPTQAKYIATHCGRLGRSVGARILELLRQDIVTHHHFDIQIEVGPTRKPRTR